MALIVLVDDELALRKIMQRALSEAGHRVHEASTAREAMTLLHIINRPVRLTIIDLRLPDRPGIDLASEIVREGLSKSVLLTSGDQSLLEELATNGTRESWSALAKPFTPQELVSAVQAILEAPGTGGEAGMRECG